MFERSNTPLLKNYLRHTASIGISHNATFYMRRKEIARHESEGF